MVSSCAEPLEVVNLMRLYGRIHFTWNLRTDQIVWNGPIHKLFGTDTPLSTGSSFLSRLTPESFWKRFSDIDGRDKKEGNEAFSSSYVVTLPDQMQCEIIEDAELIKTNQGLPDCLEGTIRIGESVQNRKNFGGYDDLTGYPSREVLYESLAVLVDQTRNEEAPGGYLVFCIDKLSLIYFVYGIEAMRAALVQVANTLKRFTRFNDVIGRTSGCSFGITLKDSDEWGVFQAADRLVGACGNLSIKTPIETFSPVLSVGGAAFREGVTPFSIIKQAEQSLFDMQNMRGTGVTFGGQMTTKVNLSRSQDTTPGKRRLADKKLEQNQANYNEASHTALTR